MTHRTWILTGIAITLAGAGIGIGLVYALIQLAIRIMFAGMGL